MPLHIRDIPIEIYDIGDISREICNTGPLFLCPRPFERHGSWILYGLVVHLRYRVTLQNGVRWRQA